MSFDPFHASRTSLSEFGLSVRRGALIGLVVLAIAAPFYWQHRSGNGPSAPRPADARPAAVSSASTTASTPTAATATAMAPAANVRPEFHGVPASSEVRRLTNWIARSHDNGPAGFVVVDKKLARAYVFDRAARLLASSPVLLGAARGDDSVPGIGSRPMAQVKPAERTTPAGRFMAEPGRNASGEDVVWVDYEAAVSMHRVRTTNPKEHRLERLASETVADNRISYGCINVPVTFYESYVRPTFAARRGVVYVLPDTKPVQQVFAGVREDAGAAESPGVPLHRSADSTASYADRPSGPTAGTH